MASQPTVLLIDDNPDEVRAHARELRSSVNVLVKEPNEVTVRDILSSQVLLVDYSLEDWPERDELSAIALKPKNGLALIGVLRAYSQTPRAFAIHSGLLRELSDGLTQPPHGHTIARAQNIDWAFSKNGSDFVTQVVSLAAAVAALHPKWPKTNVGSKGRLSKLLNINSKVDWAARAVADVESCHPPSHDFALNTRGLALLRWFLHQILPYPCFLWDCSYLAARLRVEPKSLCHVIKTEPKARKALASASYSGILCDFMGDRWWRTGVEQLIWNWTKGNPFDNSAIEDSVKKFISSKLETVDIVQPVVALDASLRPSMFLIDVNDAVEIQPDDWPAYADQAWVSHLTISDNPELQSLVVAQDREKLLIVSKAS